MVWLLIEGLLLINFISLHVGLTRTGFSATSLTIASGSVTFDNPSDGVTQTLCLGRNQRCATDPNAVNTLPQLAPELVLHPGQSVSITFHFKGEYHITSQTTPHMNLIITFGNTSCQGTSNPHCLDFPTYGIESRNGLSVPF